MRTVSIPVDTVIGVAGVVAPGNRVDINLIRIAGGKRTSRVILQDIEVLAIDRLADDAARATVTVAVDGRQGQLLSLALRSGALSLVPHGDSGASPRPGMIDPTAPLWPPRVKTRELRITDQPFHPILMPPDEAVLDPAADWFPGDTWPPEPWRP